MPVVRAIGARALPPAFEPVLAPLRDEARAVTERALANIAALREVAARLDADGVPWMLWKGPALSMQVWGEATRRDSRDLDLVVPPEAFAVARAALARDGWSEPDGLGPRGERAIHGWTRAVPLRREGRPLLELHWAFAGATYPGVPDVGAVLARAETVVVGGRPVRTPAGGDALALLALHATKHGWSQAEEVVSFARLVARWPGALAEARAWAAGAGVSRMVTLATALQAALLGPHVPRAEADGAAGDPSSGEAPALTPDARLDAMRDACLARMDAGDGAWRTTRAWTLSWIDRPRDRWRHRVGALLRPTPQEARWVRLPEALVWAYPAVRLARLALRPLGAAP